MTVKEILSTYKYDEFVIWKICPLTDVEIGLLQGKNSKPDIEEAIKEYGDIEALHEPSYQKWLDGKEYLEINIPGEEDNFYSRLTNTYIDIKNTYEQ